MEINTGNTAWLLLSSALVLLMTPGLALFYGGLNRSKGALNMMMMSFSSIGLISVLWVLYGFTLAFGTNGSSGANHVIGSFSQYFGTGTTWIGEEWMVAGAGTGIPTYAFMVFQMMFAVITVALISGAVSDRLNSAAGALRPRWFTLVYARSPLGRGGGWIGGTSARSTSRWHRVHITPVPRRSADPGARQGIAGPRVMSRTTCVRRARRRPALFGWFGFTPVPS